MIKQNILSIPRNQLTHEMLLNWAWNDTNDWTKLTATASNITWATTSPVGYQKWFATFNWTNAKITYWNAWNVRSVAMWINLTTVASTQEIFEWAANDNQLTSNSWTLTYPDWDDVLVDMVNTDTITTGWHFVYLSSTTNVACWALTLWLFNTDYWALDIAMFRTFSWELTTQEQQIFYQEWLRQLWTWSYFWPSGLLRWLQWYYQLVDLLDPINWNTLTNTNSVTLWWNNQLWIVWVADAWSSNTNKYLVTTSLMWVSWTWALSMWWWFNINTDPWNNVNTSLLSYSSATTNWIDLWYMNESNVLKLSWVAYRTSNVQVKYTTTLTTWTWYHLYLTYAWWTWNLIIYLNWVNVWSVAVWTWTQSWFTAWFRVFDRTAAWLFSSSICSQIMFFNREILAWEVLQLYTLQSKKYLI